jgi:hypothetical protein
VHAQGFSLFIAFASFCSEIPADYVTIHIEHVDGVIDDRLDEKAIVICECVGHVIGTPANERVSDEMKFKNMKLTD